MDITLKLLTVSGLGVTMGWVVDDSIVILDNIDCRVKETIRKATISRALREKLDSSRKGSEQFGEI
jgi:multidrug efflux pump subunit AcrB